MRHTRSSITKAILASVLLPGVCVLADQTSVLLTFDDLPGAGPANGGAIINVTNGYHGFQWDQFQVLDGSDTPSSGYLFGVVSPKNVAFNTRALPATLSSALDFDLNSAYLTGAWNDGLHVEVKGYNGNSLLYDNTYTVNSTGPSLINFDYLGIDRAVFTSFGGTPHGYSFGSGESFVMDNLSLTVPEPGAVGLLLCGGAFILSARNLQPRILEKRRRCNSLAHTGFQQRKEPQRVGPA